MSQNFDSFIIIMNSDNKQFRFLKRNFFFLGSYLTFAVLEAKTVALQNKLRNAMRYSTDHLRNVLVFPYITLL